MPLHEYECQVCRARFEFLYRTHGDVPETSDVSCLRCGGSVRRLIGQVSLAGRTDVGVGRAAWPSSWADTHGGNSELLRTWRQRIDRETREEVRNPELTQLRQENAIRQYEQEHGPGSGRADARQQTAHAHQHTWTAVPFVAPARPKQ